ncbi:helix-turn-helix domain-containing protein [Amycolatopsis solani]|uniref:AraC-like ligand-binding domain-containing protein n=1 Tax=Amycolatopsis solani TaxID=3028615 RepID=UPI0025B0DDF8|nr:helix-turn-helix domain-containing protein [Amycolatopsis sp. MEP2-6]
MEMLDTDQVPAGDRFAFWREINARLWAPYDVQCDRELARDFQAHVGVSAFGPVEATLMTSVPHTVRRTPKLIRQSDPGMFKISCTVRGTARVARDDTYSELPAGDMAFYDPSTPYVAGLAPDSPAHRLLLLRFPRTALHLPQRQLRELNGVRIPGKRGVGALASQFFLGLADHLHELEPADTARLATVTLDVLTEALATALDVTDALPAHVRRRALRARVHAFVRAHLGDRDLTPAMIASAHHISVRYLHKLFEEEELTVAGSIRERRLEQGRRELADPLLATRPVAAIAARWGFGGPTQFGQAFRRRYGVSPSRFRGSSAPASECAETREPCADD